MDGFAVFFSLSYMFWLINVASLCGLLLITKNWSILDWNCNNNDITSKARGNNAYNLSSMYRLSIYLLLFILQKLNCCKVEFVVAEYHWRKYWTSLMIPIGYLALSRTGTPQFVHILLMALFQWAFPSHQGL